MKKIFNRLAMLVTMLVLAVSANASAEDTVKTIIYDNSFECDYVKASSSMTVTEDEAVSGSDMAFSIVADQSWTRNINISLGKSYDMRYRNASLHFKVKKERETGSGAMARIDIKNSSQNIYYIPTVTTEWKEYEIPLKNFLKFNNYEGGFDLSDVKTVQIGVAHDGTSLKYYFDDVYLIMDAAEEEDTFTPDVVLYDDLAQGLTFGKYATESADEAYSGSKSVAFDITAKDGEDRYWLSTGRNIIKTVQLSKAAARYGYVSFKYKCDIEASGNILIQFQRYIQEDGNWGMTKNSYKLTPSETWQEAIIPIADLLGDELEYVCSNDKTLKLISLYTNGNGFLGKLYLDEIGIYYPGISAKLMYDGKRADYIGTGNADVAVKVRGIFGDAYNVYAAVYDADVLDMAKVAKCENGSKGEAEYIFNFEGGINGDSLKLMAWDDATMTPVAGCAEFGKEPLDIMYYYPGHKEKALTFSCDDGAYTSDTIFIDLLKKYDLKATFNIVGKWMNNNSSWYTSEAQKSIYDGFEIGNHGYTHAKWDSFKTDDEAKADLKTNHDYLAAQFGTAPSGLAWPFGDPNNAVLSRYVKELGMEYARPAESVSNFYMPKDWYKWKQKFCSVDNINGYGYDFLNMKYAGEPILCTFWLHSSEWNTAGKFITNGTAQQQWDVMEAFMKKASEDETIWAATNIEICRYGKALEKLVVNETSVTNPSEVDIYLSVNGNKVQIKAGETYSLP